MNKIDYSKFIEEESDDIKKLVNSIFNHPLIIDYDNRKWIDYKSRSFGCTDGGTITLYENEVENSVRGVVYIIKLLKKYNPKKIMEVGMNAGSFSLISKLTLDDVKIYTVDREHDFIDRKNQINEYFEEPLITLFSGNCNDGLFREWLKLSKTSFDFAWIDGNHSEEVATYDIETALMMNVPIIGCDDCGPELFTGVWDSVNKLSQKGLIQIIGESNIVDNVGAITLVKNLKCQ